MADTIRDLSELDRQIDNAEAHALDVLAPGRRWEQDVWFAPCGSHGCIAGNTCLDHGYHAVLGVHGIFVKFIEMPDDGPGTTPGQLAAQLLGLTFDESLALFDSANTIGVLRRLQKDLHDGRPINHNTAVQYQEDEQQERVVSGNV